MNDYETGKWLINNPEKQIIINNCKIWFFENSFYICSNNKFMQIACSSYGDAKFASFLINFYISSLGE